MSIAADVTTAQRDARQGGEETAPAVVVSAGALQLLALCEASGARPDFFCHVCAKMIRYGATIGGRYVCEECIDKARILEEAGQ